MERQKNGSRQEILEEDSESMGYDERDVQQTCWVCKCPPQAFYAIGAALVSVGTVLLAIFLSEAVPGYANTRGFEKTTCDVTIAGLVADVCCEGSVDDVAECVEDAIYPCARVLVSHDGIDDVTLYDGFYSWHFRSDTADDMKCSFFHCSSSDYDDDLDRAENFLESYTNGSSHTCYVNADEEGVALMKLPSTGTFGSLLAFSIILLTASAITFAATCFVFRSRALPVDQEKLVDDEPDEESRSETSASTNKRPETKSGIQFEIKEGFAE